MGVFEMRSSLCGLKIGVKNLICRSGAGFSEKIHRNIEIRTTAIQMSEFANKYYFIRDQRNFTNNRQLATMAISLYHYLYKDRSLKQIIRDKMTLFYKNFKYILTIMNY